MTPVSGHILWHNAETGHTQIWLLDGHRVVRRPMVLGEDGMALQVGAPWRIVGTGDFDYDGKSDILWHNAETGHTQIWLLDGHRVVRRPMVLGEDGTALQVGVPWRIVGAGNFNTPLLAREKIHDLYRRTGGSLGPLGAPRGGLVPSDGSMRQEYQLGSIVLNDVKVEPEAYTHYDVEVKLAAVKCFGTEDPGGTDETFLVISLISLNPNFGGADELVQTVRTEIDTNVEGGKVFFQQKLIGTLRAFPGSSIKIHVAVFDHEHGDADDLRDKIHAVLLEATNAAAQLIAGAAAAGDQRLAGGIGDITEFEVGGVKPFKIVTFGLADVITDILSDDMVGEHAFIIPAQNIVDIVEPGPFQASFRRHVDVLGPDVQFNWPQTDADEFLFSGGGGSYNDRDRALTHQLIGNAAEPQARQPAAAVSRHHHQIAATLGDAVGEALRDRPTVRSAVRAVGRRYRSAGPA